MIGRYERVICCSESVLAAYNRPNDKRFLAIPNGTSMPMWKRNLSEKAELRKMFHFEKDVKYFVYVGRFASGKNIPILADTFDTLNRNDIKIVMVGTGPLYEYVKNKASKNIILTGYTTRVSDYLKAADFYISTSDSEGMPNTLLENMSIGNPMLLSTIPAHKEILSNFKDNEVGFLIDQHNVDDIKDRINSIVKLDSESVAHIEQEVFLKKYTSKVMSEKYQKAYKELLSKNVWSKNIHCCFKYWILLEGHILSIAFNGKNFDSFKEFLDKERGGHLTILEFKELYGDNCQVSYCYKNGFNVAILDFKNYFFRNKSTFGNRIAL